jgi:MFS family permease
MSLLAVTPVFVAAVALYGLWQGAYGLIINNGQTLRMQILPDEYQSRVGTAARMLGWGGAPIGALLAGFVADRVPVRWVLLIAIVALLFGVVLAARTRGLLAGLEPETDRSASRPVRWAPAALRGIPVEAATALAVDAAATLAMETATALASRVRPRPRVSEEARHRAAEPGPTRFARLRPDGRHHLR